MISCHSGDFWQWSASKIKGPSDLSFTKNSGAHKTPTPETNGLNCNEKGSEKRIKQTKTIPEEIIVGNNALLITVRTEFLGVRCCFIASNKRTNPVSSK